MHRVRKHEQRTSLSHNMTFCLCERIRIRYSRKSSPYLENLLPIFLQPIYMLETRAFYFQAHAYVDSGVFCALKKRKRTSLECWFFFRLPVSALINPSRHARSYLFVLPSTTTTTTTAERRFFSFKELIMSQQLKQRALVILRRKQSGRTYRYQAQFDL